MNTIFTTFLIFGCFLLFQNNQVTAQVANYVFTETTGNYNIITIPTDATCASGNASCNSDGANGTMNGSNNPSTNADNWTLINTPFSFCMGETTFPSGTAIYMDHNGWIRLGGRPTMNATTRQAPLTNFDNVISAFGTGLYTPGNSSMGIRVEGASPNRVIVFQWGQRYFGNSGSSSGTSNNYWARVTNGHTNDRLHFQIRLYERTNVVEFHYLITNPTNTNSGTVSGVQIGLRGGSASDFNIRAKTTTNSAWNNNTSAGTTLANTVNFNNVRNDVNNKPGFVLPSNPGSTTSSANTGTGTIFRWTPVGGPSADPSDWSGCYFSPLAVTLNEFIGFPEKRSNKLEWATESEINNDYFVVETSTNGIDWHELDRVNGMGTTIVRNSYKLYHQNPEDIQYYRLNQVDFDGTKTNYGPIVVERKILLVTLIRTTNLLGQDVNESYKGVILLHYSDGTTVKIYQ